MFKHRIIVNQLKFIAKNLALPDPMFCLVQNLGLDIVTRSHSARDLKLTNPNVSIYRKSFCYQGPSEWNKLPTELKAIQSFPSFKYKVKNHFRALYSE